MKKVLVCCVGFYFLLPQEIQARNYHTKECGAPVPTWGVRKIGKNRYRSGYSSMDSALKFYKKKVFNWSRSKYLIRRLLVMRSLTSYHLKSKKSYTRWSGINLTLYRRTGRVELFIICRK